MATLFFVLFYSGAYVILIIQHFSPYLCSFTNKSDGTYAFVTVIRKKIKSENKIFYYE